MKKQKSGSVWMILPLYIFTLIFVAGPLLYMVALSFAQPKAGHGVEWIFTLDNYRKILDPVYMKTFTGSFQLAVTSTLIICLLGYPFGYFMAKLSDKWKKRAMIFLMLPFWVNSLIRLYGWMIILQTKGLLNHVLKSLGLIEKPLRILYSYPAIVIGMTYVLLPFMILSVYSSAEKLDWSLVEAARDLGASPMRTLCTGIVPQLVPGMVSGFGLAFTLSLDDYVISKFINGDVQTISTMIYSATKKGIPPVWRAVSSLIFVLVMIALIMINVSAKKREKESA